MNLNGKVALITGSSRGIGATTALKMAENGADLIINYPFEAEKENAEAVVARIKELGRKAIACEANVAVLADTEELIKKVVKEFGRLDILVNNAGITRDSLLLRMKESDWEAVINVNLTGVFNCTKAVTGQMIKQKYGKIINITSVVGIIGNPGQANYSAAKAGVIGLTKTTAKELAKRGITANAVAPGFIESQMTENLPETAREKLFNAIPLKRLGQPADVADLICFLASAQADYITGQVINVDGGMVM
ncbi:MAG: 3-oxoacyl-[acyl-carrier-protein] reductase [Halanaerobiales bacterium]|nr:3-oxoacyl-[acyl-carrier-protein] reductase [Halanaerobiales bacterium]